MNTSRSLDYKPLELSVFHCLDHSEFGTTKFDVCALLSRYAVMYKKINLWLYIGIRITMYPSLYRSVCKKYLVLVC